MGLAGLFLRRERLRRGWSQEGLCRGVCAVSYLSKIEQGKATPSDEVLALLFGRLGLSWYDGDDAAADARIEACYTLLFSGEGEALKRTIEAQRGELSALAYSRFAVDAMLLTAFVGDERAPLEADLEPFMTPRQLAIQRVLQERFDDALRLCPAAWIHLYHGRSHYHAGRYMAAMEALRAAHDAAAQDGYARILLLSRAYMGNCYADLRDSTRMREHYAAAERLARALHEEALLETLRYNTAATDLECGRVQEAYSYFSQKAQPSALDLHKLAVCCEKLGRREEALAALDAARSGEPCGVDPGLLAPMLSLVRYRLEHPAYLGDPAYGALLLGCFDSLRRRLPSGYAVFHLPWVLEWYKANRQYKQACALLEDFPGFPKESGS